MDEVTRELFRRAGVKVNPVTVRKALREAGIVRLKPIRRAGERAAVQGKAPTRYGYTAAHRRNDGIHGMNTDLTEVEWALVAHLFERHGLRGHRLALSAARWSTPAAMCCARDAPGGSCPRPSRRGRWSTCPSSAGLWPARSRPCTIGCVSSGATAQGGNTGFDAGKKVKGRKRHLVVDTVGLLLAVTVTAARVQSRDAAAEVVARACARVPDLKKLYADAAYGGPCAQAIEQTRGIAVEVVRHPANRSTGTWHEVQQPLQPEVVAKGFVVQAKRWVVERTHAWNDRARRLMAHHDRSRRAPVAWVWLAQARILATRLTT